MEELIRQLQRQIDELKAEVERLSTATGVDKTSLTFTEQASTPATPADGTECRVYMRTDRIIFQYNDGGTVRWKYLTLSGTGTTWAHTTSAP